MFGLSKWLGDGITGDRQAGRPARLVALTATRDDEWVLGLSLRASLSYCDVVVVTDHRSGPRTAAILREAHAEFPHRVLDVRRCDDEHWMEADVRQEMLQRARTLGGTHFVVADSDELPTANLLPRLRELALAARPGAAVPLPMISPYHSGEAFRWDGNWGADNRIPWAFGDRMDLAWKTADGYQLHWRMPSGVRVGPLELRGHAEGGLFHLQFANAMRLRCKAAWYKMTETLRYPGKRTPQQLNSMYDWTLREHDRMELLPVPGSWWDGYRELGWLRHYQPEQEPWQLREIRRMLDAHGAAPFRGLDLHGVIQT